MTEKLCHDCQIMKPTTEFHKDKSKRDGLNLYCKPCARARTKKFSARPGIGTAVNGMKRCGCCKKTLPAEAFHASGRTFDGFDKRCKACCYAMHDVWRRKNLKKVADHSRKWRTKNPVLARDHGLKSRYGLALGEYEKMLCAQNGGCAICKKTESGGRGGLHVDHCHDTGCIRGLLCHGCNVSIGHFKHDPTLLRAAALYLELLPKGGAEGASAFNSHKKRAVRNQRPVKDLPAYNP